MQGRNFIAHVVFSVDETGAPVLIRGDFDAVVTHPGAGIYQIDFGDSSGDCAIADAVPIMSSSPDGGVTGGKFVGQSWLRTAAKTFRMYTHVGSVQLDAGPPAVFGFAAGGAPVDPSDGTILTFSLDRVDTV